MRRRTYLAGSVGVIGGLAGCSGILGGSGGGEPEGPAETAAAFYEALADGDVGTANGYVHSESPTGQVPASAAENFESLDMTVEGTTVVSRDDGRATIELQISAVVQDGSRETRPVQIDLRTEDDEWRVYENATGGGRGPSAPSVVWDSSERTNENGAVAAVVFEHGGGDTADSTMFRAAAGGGTAGPPGQSSDIATGDAIVVPLDGDGASLGAGTQVSLIWSAPDGSTSQELATHTIQSDAAGSLAASLSIEA